MTSGATLPLQRRTPWTSSCRTCAASSRPVESRACCTPFAARDTCCGLHEAHPPAAGPHTPRAHLGDAHVRDPRAVRDRDRPVRLEAGPRRVRRRPEPYRGRPPAASGELARARVRAVAMPKPEAQAGVADLANTLEDMLRALDDARAETEGALARQREFVADASHELRTPLTSILTNLELLEADLEGEGREMAGSALRSSRRMRRLVADLLLLARADAGRHGLREEVDLAAAVSEAAAEAAPVAAGHVLSLDLPNGNGGGPIVYGVSDDLHRP